MKARLIVAAIGLPLLILMLLFLPRGGHRRRCIGDLCLCGV